MAGLPSPAFQKKEVALMRRILLVLAVAALMTTTMLAVAAGPAFAIVILDKEGCKEAKARLKAEGLNQGQCIQATQDSPVLLPY